jgi:hypothetical protein
LTPHPLPLESRRFRARRENRAILDPRHLRTAVAALALGVGLQPAAASEVEVYRWVDEEGVSHYAVDRARVPGGHRQVERLETPPPTLTLTPSGIPMRLPPENEPLPPEPGSLRELPAPAGPADPRPSALPGPATGARGDERSD